MNTPLQQCAQSGQMDSRQIASHQAAGELLPCDHHFGCGDCECGHNERAAFTAQELWDWLSDMVTAGKYVAVGLLAIAVVAFLSWAIYSIERISTLWPWAVAALS